jgi:DNA primase
MAFITQFSKDEIIEKADIVAVVSSYVKLTKRGANHNGLCPFHNEKTPSFTVAESKGIFKCFGCGKAGDAITFIREHEGLEFYEALERIAEIQNITVEREEEKDPKWVEKKIERETQLAMLEWSAAKMEKELFSIDADHWSKSFLKKKGFSFETLTKFRIGFTPGNGFLKDSFAMKGKCNDASRLWLLSKKGTPQAPNFYDKLFNRISFPLIDDGQRVLGISGRRSNEDEGPKYLNPSDTPSNATSGFIFRKKEFLYGIHAAKQEIRKTNEVYLVEGYTDVMAFYEGGVKNVVASSGTALTTEQLAYLRKICHTVNICFDMDEKENGENPGLEAAMKQIPIVMKFGFRVNICLFPVGMDPNDFQLEVNRYVGYRSVSTLPEFKFVAEHNVLRSLTDWGTQHSDDAYLAFWLNEIKEDALAFSIDTLTVGYDKLEYNVLRSISELIILLPEGTERIFLIESVAKKYKIKVTLLKNIVQEVEEEYIILQETSEEKEAKQTPFKLPKGVDSEDFFRWGFYPQVINNSDNTGYYFRTNSEGNCAQVSNFIVNPLFHKYEKGANNARIIEIDNGYERKIVEMPSESMLKPDQFKKVIFNEGPFFFDGVPAQLSKIVRKMMFDFPLAYELETLGQQPEGFFSYCSHIFDGTVREFNKTGLLEYKNKNYFSPSVSDIYKDIRDDGDDQFETDRCLTYCVSPITFEKWGSLMHGVYGEHALAAIPYLMVTLFRSIVFSVDNNCPHLYLYGPSESGKSKIMESLLAFCFKGMPAFQMSTGTEFAFYAKLNRFRDLPSGFNEVDEDSMSEERFQAVKGAYDGEGRERGRMNGGKRSEVMKVVSTLILVGQYLITKDDNSIVNRSIVRAIEKQTRTQDQVDRFKELKEYEKKGLNSLVIDIIKHREFVAANYAKKFSETMKQLSAEMKKMKVIYSDRVLRNYSTLGTMIQLFEDKLPIGMKWDGAIPADKNGNSDAIDGRYCWKNWAIQEIVNLSGLMVESDILNDFWSTLEGLLDEGKLRLDLHFRVSTETSITVDNENNFGPETIDKTFEPGKRLIFLRVRECRRIYAASKKSGEKAMSATNVNTYIKNRPYYIGSMKNKDFRGDGKVLKTSCVVLDYDKIGTNLYRTLDPTFEKTEVEEEGAAENKEKVVVVEKKVGLAKSDESDDLPF